MCLSLGNGTSLFIHQQHRWSFAGAAQSSLLFNPASFYEWMLHSSTHRLTLPDSLVPCNTAAHAQMIKDGYVEITYRHGTQNQA
jgi:hypothetical protein